MTSASLPLCVDLDGTLTPVDTLHEGLIALAKSSPLSLFALPAQISRGKAAFKAFVAERAPLDAEVLPIRPDLLEWLHTQKNAGRHLVLVTASDRRTAEAVAERVGLFDEVIASDGQRNLAGQAKREVLVQRFGEKGFDYAGNDVPDLQVWRSAAHAIVVGDEALTRKAAEVCAVDRRFPASQRTARTWIRALRLHQWVKNALVFMPALLAHQIGEPATLIQALLAFLAFGLCASSVYVFNDLLDLPSDRRHARKRNRPFAEGLLPAKDGVIAGTGLLLGSAAVAATVGPWFCLALAAYYLLTWAYSLRLKRVALIDVMMLAGLYTMRIIAGSAATLIWPSFWLLGFSVFMFLSLGIAKRFAELDDAKQAGAQLSHGRGYGANDLPLLQSLGTSAGYCSIVVLALYINSAASGALYTHAKALWLLPPVMLFWISRVWLVTSRGQMHDDPIVFALRDRVSLVLAVLMAFGVLIAI
ncbi:4-hydroxybenzoate polyprenyltransferase [Panacagrimonas perspica]|uniref:4-hydroxybenzoate polyprenyltransferase n=1 Tax=Panacagrimonas perspica TaxID=381431 RepID=A0A4S3KA48_9GAMM|nr:UbiA family prenyltransferase [Panacagrimonas perspica]TDU28704.1 4-hydroxybenzoate polyprenyltransferase [Panacagrimonas perspica]THD05028.1 hypothetical protein B1810_03540 [Panacagrimonas perspica]